MPKSPDYPKPTPEESPFQYPRALSAIGVMHHLSAFVETQPGEPRRQNTEKTLSRLSFNLETYTALKLAIHHTLFVAEQKTPPDEEKAEKLRAMEAVIDTPPKYTKLRLHFSEHAVTNLAQYETGKQEFVAMMSDTFEPKTRNIVIQEFGRDDKKSRAALIEGFKKFKSGKSAVVWEQAVTRLEKRPTDPQVPRLVTSLERNVLKLLQESNFRQLTTDEAITLHNVMQFDALDIVLAQGHTVELQLESMPKRKDVPSYDLPRDPTAPDFIEKIIEITTARDQNVTAQLFGISGEAEQSRKPTRVLLSMGQLHISVATLLPEKLKPVTKISVSDEAVLDQ